MLTFLKDFAGITEQLNNLEKATHKEIRYLGLQNVVAVPFEYVDNDHLATGEILLVLDIEHHIAPYQNPLRMKKKIKRLSKKEIS